MVAPDAFLTAAHQWSEGERHVRGAPADRQRSLERIVERIHADLRRRLGSRFVTAELVALYDQGTSWATEIATRTAPDDPDAWDPRLADAAFARYVREASDYAGGKRILEES